MKLQWYYLVLLNLFTLITIGCNGKNTILIDDEITTNEFEDVISEEYLDEYDDEDAPLKKDPSFFNRRRNTKPPNCGTKNLISCPGIAPHINGCGPNGPLSKTYIPFRRTFTKSCNKHDVCYRCGKSRHWSQRSCDRSFKKDMYKACNCKYYNNFFKRVACKKIASTLYGLVRIGGQYFYSKAIYNACYSKCAFSYGNPEIYSSVFAN